DVGCCDIHPHRGCLPDPVLFSLLPNIRNCLPDAQARTRSTLGSVSARRGCQPARCFRARVFSSAWAIPDATRSYRLTPPCLLPEAGLHESVGMLLEDLPARERADRATATLFWKSPFSSPV